VKFSSANKTLFLTLRIFSATGGIEKVCRIFGKALYEGCLNLKQGFEVCSMYDTDADAADNIYFPSENFKGFGIAKFLFILKMLPKGIKSSTVILSHINLLPVGWLIKKLSPKTNLVLLAHGIEVWEPIGKRKRQMLNTCDKIVAVSNFTRNKIIAIHGIALAKCRVLNNCLDPFLPLPTVVAKDQDLLNRYGFNTSDKILMTLSRLSSKERYKGYDNVIESIAGLGADGENIKYLIAGSYDADEKKYLDELLQKLGLQDNIVMPGFIPDEELEAHFAMADIYIMPSRKEGFGIVFIEAMYYGVPVIGGNMDGSVDALLNGELGQLVNPENIDEIRSAIQKILSDKKTFMPNRALLYEHFSYERYKWNLEMIG
jgi:glycosyltransferase involved in cell wall biosynthesis